MQHRYTVQIFTKIQLVVLALIVMTSIGLAQDDTYYSAINPASVNFISDLKGRIRAPYTKIAYASYDETNVANFSSYVYNGTQRAVNCVYSGYVYVYTPPFAWGTMSREHTWCHSWMPTYSSTSGDEYADQHHLFPTEQNHANGVRSNHPLGIVTQVQSTFLECKYGKDANGNTVFEPRDRHKGDAARALLYMAMKYDGVNNNAWTFNWLNGTRLPSTSEGPMDLNLLIQWHKQDPPDKWEVDRNNYVQSIQSNRNPFVDHPEYVNYINFNDISLLSPTYAAEPENFITNLTATTGSGKVTLNWTDAAAGAQAPSGYLIEAYSTNNYFIPIDGSTYTDDTNLSDGVARVNVAHGSGHTYTFNGLSSGTTYYFRVYSYNGTGTSVNYKIVGTIPSVSATVTTADPAVEPTNYPTGLAAGTITYNSIALTWTDAAAGTQAPSGYLLMANTTNSFTAPVDGTVYSDDILLSDGSAVVNISNPSTGTYTFNTLNPNTTYYFRMYSYNGAGAQINYKTDGTAPSISATTATVVLATEPTNYVTNFAVGTAATSTVTLNWTDAVAGAQAPSGYLIVANTSNSFTDPVDGTQYADDEALADGSAMVNITYPSTGTYTFSGLNSGVTYYFRMYSYNGLSAQINYKTSGTVPAVSQTTTVGQVSYSPVLLDNFNRPNSTVLGSSPNMPSGLSWTEIETSAPASISIVNLMARMASTTAGREFALVDLTKIPQYPVNLDLASQTITWAFNMRSTRANPSGFDATNFGYGVVLGKTTADVGAGNGYAVVHGQSGSSDYIRLTKFTNGLDANSKFSDIIASTTAFTNEFLSVKVTYNPPTHQWALYVEGNATAFPRSDPRQTSAQMGSLTTESTYTGLQLKYFGMLWNHNTSATDSAAFDDIYISGPGGLLPVELVSFNVKQVKENVVLAWKTATEVNNYGFYVERSQDGISWDNLGMVRGAGSTSEAHSYLFNDRPVSAGKYQYRLRQVDNNGTTTFSSIQSVSYEFLRGFELQQAYPNPFNPTTLISYNIKQKGLVSLKVYDALGSEVAELVNREQESGYYSVTFNAHGLVSGTYICVLRSNGFTATQKIMLLK
ncbi:MAG: endonuclease [Ignavibacteria bacterium]|nr:endonuclease [Ignavibacteria bacterium]